MSDVFYKFPSTPHLAVLGDTDVRDDKVMTESERSEFLEHKVIVEEKIDGANLGISFSSAGDLRVQNRGSYLCPPYSGQWKTILEWLDPKIDSLFDSLQDHSILFGEWCYARHSVAYNRLPDWFLGFDIFNKATRKFLSCQRRNELLCKASISPVPMLARGCFSFVKLTAMLVESHVGDEPAEGIYLRVDAGDWLTNRAKLVRPQFIQSIEEHWSHGPLTPNRTAPKVWA